MDRLDGKQATAGGLLADQVDENEVAGPQHVGARVEVRRRDDRGGPVMAAEMPKGRAVGVAKDRQFNRVHNWVQDKANSILINASRMDEEFDGIATGLSAAITRDGQTTVTADLPMAGFKHTGVGNASARNQYATVAQVQDGGAVFAVAGGAADALTLTVSPAVTAYAAGQAFWARLTATNTGAATLAVSGLAAKAIKKRGADVAAGDLTSGNVAGFAYQSATDTFELVTPTVALNRAQSWSAAQTFAAGIVLNAEALSHYDEGTFTPGLTINGSAAGITFAVQSGRYTRIGNRVFLQIALVLTSNGSNTGNVAITGLPFTVNANGAIPLAVNYSNLNLNTAGGFTQVAVLTDASGTNVIPYEVGDNVGRVQLTDTAVTDTADFRIGGQYEI